MSAYLDKSQGITFVYSNIHDIYQKARHAKLDAPFVAELTRASAASPAPVTRVIKAKDARVEEFKPEQVKPTSESERPYAVPMGVREAEEKAKRAGARPLAQLQKNLSELTDAHEKLRFLLQELEALSKKKS